MRAVPQCSLNTSNEDTSISLRIPFSASPTCIPTSLLSPSSSGSSIMDSSTRLRLGQRKDFPFPVPMCAARMRSGWYRCFWKSLNMEDGPGFSEWVLWVLRVPWWLWGWNCGATSSLVRDSSCFSTPKITLHSLVPRPSHHSVLDCLQYAKTGWSKGLGMRLYPTLILLSTLLQMAHG